MNFDSGDAFEIFVSSDNRFFYKSRVFHDFFSSAQNHTARVNISVEDVNEWEPRFRHPRYEFHARTLRDGSIVGEYEYFYFSSK